MKFSILFCVTSLLVFLFYRAVFSFSPLVNTDLPYLYSFPATFLPSAWDMQRGAGMGGVFSPFLWYYLPILLPIKILLNILGFPWEFVQRVVLFLPFLLLGSIGSFQLARHFTKDSVISLIAPLLFFLNSYILLLISGGQLQIGIGICLLLLLLLSYFFIFTPENSIQKKKGLILFPLFFLFLGWYELRILILGSGALVICFLFDLITSKQKIIYLRTVLGVFSVSGVLWAIGNLYWIIPVLLHKTDPVKDLGKAFYSSDALSYFSFATIEYTFSLHHPFWPENIFGKMQFFSPVFLLLPLLLFGFLALGKIKQEYKKGISIGLVFLLTGTFFAKGVTEPFGKIYEYFFFYIPGFSLFRDPSKFFIILLIGYIFLLPLAIKTISDKFPKLKLAFFLLGVISLIIPVYSFALSPKGALQGQNVPEFYQQVTSYLENKKDFGRVLWIPTTSVYSYYSYTHPAVPAFEYLNVYSHTKLHALLIKPEIEERIRNSSIHYVVIPKDTQQNIFIEDRKYNDSLYRETVSIIESLPWLTRVAEIPEGHVFEVVNPKPHLWSDMGKSTSFTQINPSRYEANVTATKNHTYIFAESFDPFWKVTVDGKNVPTSKTKDDLLAFTPKEGEKVIIEYTHQNVTNNLSIGLFLTFVIYSIYSLIIWKKIT